MTMSLRVLDEALRTGNSSENELSPVEDNGDGSPLPDEHAHFLMNIGLNYRRKIYYLGLRLLYRSK